MDARGDGSGAHRLCLAAVGLKFIIFNPIVTHRAVTATVASPSATSVADATAATAAVTAAATGSSTCCQHHIWTLWNS